MANERASEIEREMMRHQPPGRSMPGGRAALPEGALSKPYFGPHGDEHRDPLKVPVPVPPAPIIDQDIAVQKPPVASEMNMLRVARRRDLRDSQILRTKVGETEIILVCSNDQVRAFSANCPHAGAPLDGGAVCNGRLICPWHKAEFNISDGSLLEPPALDGLTRYETRMDGDDILVATEPLPPQPAPPRHDRRTIAIIGSGAAGTAAAAGLRRRGFDGRVLLIGPEAAAPYDRTALSKFVLSGEMPADDVTSLRQPDWFTRNQVERVDGGVARIDVAGQRLYLGDDTCMSYDAALLAMGAVARRPNIPGVQLHNVYTLRDCADATAIVDAAQPRARVVIMGSSFIGLEAASALRKRGLPVTVVAPETIPFKKQFGPEIGRMLLRLHVANGVAFRLDSGIEAIEGADEVVQVRLKGGEILPADIVLVGIGVEPATRAISGLPIDADGALVVDASFRVAENLYAAGDCAVFPFQHRSVRIEHWRVAQQHGDHVSAAMLGESRPYDGVPFFWTYHYGQRFEYIGHPTEWDSIHVDGDLDAQQFIALQISRGQVVGIIACQRERETSILIDRMRRPLSATEALHLVQPAGIDRAAC